MSYKNQEINNLYMRSYMRAYRRGIKIGHHTPRCKQITQFALAALKAKLTKDLELSKHANHPDC